MSDEKDWVPRKRTLTDADLEELRELLAVTPVHPAGCTLGFTPEEVSILKRIIRAFDRAANITGTLILTAIIMAVIGFVTKGFWTTLITGVKTGAVPK